MSDWTEPFGSFMIGAALLLSMIGLWFTAIIPSLDGWSKRFFRSYFFIFMLCCLSGIAEVVFQNIIIPEAVFRLLLFLEDMLLSLLLPMLTVFLLHCCGEDIRSSKLLHAVIGLLAIQIIIFASPAFIEGFFYISPENEYYRGPLYPLFLMPALAIVMLNLMGTIHSKKCLSHKAFLACFVSLIPVMVSLIILLFVDAFQLVDLSIALSALSMYSFILSDQIEQDRLRQQKIILREREITSQQREIAEQQRKIANQQREIANQRSSVMVLQMRPHFIYNTLMSIYSLCRLDPMKARQVTMDFTNYLRRNFNAVANDNAILFSEELEHTRAYLAVEQVQFNNMLVVDWDTTFENFRLPSLTVQPIVENAVKHGINPPNPLRISVRTQHTDTCTKIIVEDNGRGFDPSDESKPHTTLENIQQRLEMMCDGSMTIQSHEGGGTVVTLVIPDSTGRKKGSEEL